MENHQARENMATSSIFADFSIRSPKKANRFADALIKSAKLTSNKNRKSRKRLSVVSLNGAKEIKAFLHGETSDK